MTQQQDPHEEARQFTALLQTFIKPHVDVKTRDQAALGLAQILINNPDWKEDRAIHQTLLTHTTGFGLSSQPIKILHDVVISCNETAERHVFDQELKRFSAHHTSGLTRETLAHSLTEALIKHPSWKLDGNVYTAIVADTEGSSSPLMKDLLQTAMTGNPDGEMHLFVNQFRKFSSLNAKVQTQQFYAPRLAQLITDYPELATEGVKKSIAAALDRNPSNPALQELQKAVVAAITPPPPLGPPKSLPSP